MTILNLDVQLAHWMQEAPTCLVVSRVLILRGTETGTAATTRCSGSPLSSHPAPGRRTAGSTARPPPKAAASPPWPGTAGRSP